MRSVKLAASVSNCICTISDRQISDVRTMYDPYVYKQPLNVIPLALDATVLCGSYSGGIIGSVNFHQPDSLKNP